MGKRRERSRSSSSSSKVLKKKRKSRSKSKKKRKHRDSSSSTSSSCSSSSDDSSPHRSRRAHKKRKKKKKHRIRSSSSSSSSSSRERKKTRKKKKKRKSGRNDKEVGEKISKTQLLKSVPQNQSKKDVKKEPKVMKPMTKEEWEKQQSVIRRVYDPETGRNRLVKGDGEILEEIVSKDRHKEINKQSTLGDGQYFQAKMGLDHR